MSALVITVTLNSAVVKSEFSFVMDVEGGNSETSLPSMRLVRAATSKRLYSNGMTKVFSPLKMIDVCVM